MVEINSKTCSHVCMTNTYRVYSEKSKQINKKYVYSVPWRNTYCEQSGLIITSNNKCTRIHVCTLEHSTWWFWAVTVCIKLMCTMVSSTKHLPAVGPPLQWYREAPDSPPDYPPLPPPGRHGLSHSAWPACTESGRERNNERESHYCIWSIWTLLALNLSYEISSSKHWGCMTDLLTNYHVSSCPPQTI